MLSFFKRTTKHFLNTSSPGPINLFTGNENGLNDVNGSAELTTYVETSNDTIDNFVKNQPTIVVQQQDINTNDHLATTDSAQMASTTNHSGKKAQKRNKSKHNKHSLVMVNKPTNRHSTPIMTISSASTSIATPLMSKRSEPQKIVHSVKPNVHFSEGPISHDDKSTIIRSVSMSTTQLNDKNWDYDNDKKLVINQETKINELLKTLADKELKIKDLRFEIEGLTCQLNTKNASIECNQNIDTVARFVFTECLIINLCLN